MDHLVPEPSRAPSAREQVTCVPTYVVWELTLACNLKCLHCGSRAGVKRANELSTAQCKALVRDLAEMGTREITLIGGEAYLRPDWLEIIREIDRCGILATLQTGGYGLGKKLLERAKKAGLSGVGVSIDGLEQLHNRLRGVPGSFDAALGTLRACKELEIISSVNTQIGAETMGDLEGLMAIIAQEGARFWQVQLTVAMGNAVENDQLLLQPHQLLELMPLLAKLATGAHSDKVTLLPGNNIGYFGPYEVLWRGPERGGHYAGCPAGQNVIGIEADGTIKGCPSLPTLRYAAGNVHKEEIRKIWMIRDQMEFNRSRSTGHLSGFCASCYYSDVCRGGCTWTADALLGNPGNNPYCHHRAIQLARRGKQERVEKVASAPAHSFATGLFRIVEEDLNPKYVPLVPPLPQAH